MVKKFVASFLIFVVALSCSGCVSFSTLDSQNSSNGEEIILGVDKLEDSSIQTEAEKTVLTLDDAEVKLVYTEGDYLLLAYYGPQEDIGMHYCTSDGESRDDFPHPFYWEFNSDWRLIKTDELPDDVDGADIALSVTDYNDDSKPSRVFSDLGSPMSESELQEIGVCFFNGYAGNVSSYGSVYKEDITITLEFNWWGADRNIRIDNWPFTTDNCKFFISDGTPLDEAYEGYEMWIETKDVGGGQIWVNLTGNKEATNEDFKKLAALEPYMIFTGDDGSTLRIELLEENRN